MICFHECQQTSAAMKFDHHQLFNTYSIVARDAETGQFGVAVQTHQMGVGRVVPWLLPGVGAVATQSFANASFGRLGLALLKAGYPAHRVIAALVAADEDEARRRVAVVDNQGQAAVHTGSGCIAHASHHVGQGYSVQANMMTRDTVIDAMASAYEAASGDLAQRMVTALEAAQAEDGDIRGMQSAALKVVSGDAAEMPWETVYDLRVDEHAQPVVELVRLVRLRHAQLIDKQGYDALEAGQRDEALNLWSQAREQAPELEELAFWQAVELADKHGDLDTAASIFQATLADDPRRQHWADLINRLVDCGLIENAVGAALRDRVST